MARGIIVNHGGEVSDCGITRVDREKLYGKKLRLVVDAEGNPCVSGLITADGRALLPPGSIAYNYLDEHGETVERSDLVMVNGAGELQPLKPSTLGKEQALAGPIAPARLLDHTVTTVYQLDAAGLGPRLREALLAGQIFETRFNWRDDYADSPCFLVGNELGFFALVALETPMEFLRREVVVTEDTVEEEVDDDLDFSMM